MEPQNMQVLFKTYGPSIVDISTRKPEISAADVAVALGAESRSEIVSTSGRLPMRYAYRSELYMREKIPVSSENWAILQQIANQLAKSGNTPSAEQVGRVLMSLAIASVNEADSPVGSYLKTQLTNSTH